MTKNDKKQELQKYATLCCEAVSKVEERRTWLSFLQVMSAEKTDTDIAEKIWQIDNELNCEVLALIEMRNKISGLIAKLDDPTLRTVLHRRYMLGDKFEKIAEEMNYSWRHILRLHDKAISAL